jgi:hypothetical protein
MSRSVALVRVAGLVVLTLVLAHEAVFLARYGSTYGEALQHSGHGSAWSDAVTVVLLGAALILAGSLAGVYRLTRQVATASRDARDRATILGPADLRRISRGWLGMALALGPTVLVLLTIQENLEHLSAGLALPGMGILISPEYPFAVVITLAAALGVALVATLLAWRRDVLVGRLRALAPQPRRRPSLGPQPRSVRLAARRGSILARRLGRRAPPVLLAA